ncbi:MAG: hypothetical protein VW378_06200 [bacterium]
MMNKKDKDIAIKQRHITPLKGDRFKHFCSKLTPIVKNFPERVALLKVMAVLKLEGVISDSLTKKCYKKIQVLRDALLLEEKHKKGLDGTIK